MNGPHDLGGAHGFGPVMPEDNEPVFHADWERRAFALVLAMGYTGRWTIDATRHSRERIPPAQYLSSGYYRIWFDGLIWLLVEHGLVSAAEIEAGRSLSPPADVQPVPADGLYEKLMANMSYARPTATPALFKPGDSVRARVMHPAGHTRLPRYARGRAGKIAAVHGCHIFPDSSALSKAEEAHWLYSVTFTAPELWGPEGRAGDEIRLDLWEPYLEPA